MPDWFRSVTPQGIWPAPWDSRYLWRRAFDECAWARSSVWWVARAILCACSSIGEVSGWTFVHRRVTRRGRDIQQEETSSAGRWGGDPASRSSANTAISCRSFVGERAAVGNPARGTELNSAVGDPSHRCARDGRRPDHHLDRRDARHPGRVGHDRADGPGNADRHRWLHRDHRDHAVCTQQAALTRRPIAATDDPPVRRVTVGLGSAPGDRKMLVVDRSGPGTAPGPAMAAEGGDNGVPWLDYSRRLWSVSERSSGRR